jgi:hypothetical protein
MPACRLSLALANRHAPQVRYIRETEAGIFMIDTILSALLGLHKSLRVGNFMMTVRQI